VALSLVLPEAATVRAEVYDALGRLVLVQPEVDYAAGGGSLALDTWRLAPGVYVVRVTFGREEVAVRRFVVSR
jgi:hypothetical protein